VDYGGGHGARQSTSSPRLHQKWRGGLSGPHRGLRQPVQWQRKAGDEEEQMMAEASGDEEK
jgi:hypothetical protein